MPSPETDDPAALIAAPPATPRRRPRWPWLMLALAAAASLLVTLAGSVTSPPHVKAPPVGHLIYLDADQPSEHTTNLRGLRVMSPDGTSRQLLHETEAQDSDTGKREWFTQPQASPDGEWLAYERQDMTILEERKEIVNQLWAVSLKDPHHKPRMLLDLTKAGLKQFVGLAWTPDSNLLTFLVDDKWYTVGTERLLMRPYSASSEEPVPSLSERPLSALPPLSLSPVISATRSPFFTHDLPFPYTAQTPNGPVLVSGPNRVTGVSVSAFSPDGRRVAYLADKRSGIAVADAHTLRVTQTFKAAWGWSVFGGRRVTSLKWSPDGRHIGYTVSKPPLEDELFYVDTTTRKCYQLPVRTGQGGWDWAP